MSIENCSMPSITGFNPFSSTTNMLSIENCMLFTVFYVLLMSSFYYSAIIITQYYTRRISYESYENTSRISLQILHRIIHHIIHWSNIIISFIVDHVCTIERNVGSNWMKKYAFVDSWHDCGSEKYLLRASRSCEREHPCPSNGLS